MTFMSDPVDAKAAKTRLRLYTLALTVAALIGGWCTLLQIAWFFAEDGIVDHIPEPVRVGAFFVALAWVYGVIHAFMKLPAIIDDIVKHGLVMTDEHDHRPGTRR